MTIESHDFEGDLSDIEAKNFARATRPPWTRLDTIASLDSRHTVTSCLDAIDSDLGRCAVAKLGFLLNYGSDLLRNKHEARSGDLGASNLTFAQESKRGLLRAKNRLPAFKVKLHFLAGPEAHPRRS